MNTRHRANGDTWDAEKRVQRAIKNTCIHAITITMYRVGNLSAITSTTQYSTQIRNHKFSPEQVYHRRERYFHAMLLVKCLLLIILK